MTVISAANGEPPVEVTPRQIAIGKAIGAVLGGVPVAILLLAFQSNMGSASPEVTQVAAFSDPAAEEAARAKAEAQAYSENKAGVFFASCTEMPSEGARVQRYRELSYRDGKVRESTSSDCGGPKS